VEPREIPRGPGRRAREKSSQTPLLLGHLLTLGNWRRTRVYRAEYPADGQKERTVQLVPYLIFDGQCEAAFKFYAECLGGKIEAMMPHRGTPVEQHVSPDWQDKILHARLNTGDGVLMGSDAPPGRYEEPKGFSVSLQVENPAEAERIFRALAEKGTVRMPLEKTFWAQRFGMLVDRFGIPWMVNCE
jgi:PhnB protein